MSRARPRIWLEKGRWWCAYCRGPNRYASGSTPKTAYESWLLALKLKAAFN